MDDGRVPRHLAGERRQQIIDIEKEVQELAIRRREEREQEAIRLREQREQERILYLNGPFMPPRFTSSYPIRERRHQQIVDFERQVQELANRRREEREREGIRLREQLQQERLLYLNGPFMPQRFTSSYPIRDREADSNQQRIPRETVQWQVEPEDERRLHPTAPQMPSWLENISTIGITDRPEAGYSQTVKTDGPQAEYSQLMADIVREVEQRRHEELRPHPNAPQMPSRLENISTIGITDRPEAGYSQPMKKDRPQAEYSQPMKIDGPQAEYSQLMTDIVREVEQRRHEERRPNPNAPHMPFTLNDSSRTAASNTSTTYPFEAPLSPESEMLRHLRFPDRPSSIDDGLREWVHQPYPSEPRMPSRLINSSTNRITDRPEAAQSQQITNVVREVEQRDERRPRPNAPHMPFRSNDISRTPATDTTYPFAPSMSPESEMLRHLRFPDRPSSIDDGLRDEQHRESHMPSRLINSSTNRITARPETTIVREVHQREERRPHPNAPYMPFSLNNSSTTPAPNSSTNYPFAPPMSPEYEILRHLRFPDRPSSIDDGLPTYEEAIAINYTKSSVTAQPY